MTAPPTDLDLDAQPAENAGQPDPEATEAAEDAVEQAGALQPTDLIDRDTLENEGTLATFEGAGNLAIDPRQEALSERQRYALLAIGINTTTDPLVKPHIAPFIHLCQVRGLDPWAREVYLIGRGTGENRKFTMQVGIDGYAKLGNSTGRFDRVGRVLWTGRGDDPVDWRELEDGTMDRRWFTQWPEARGHPGAAQATIFHLSSATGDMVETTMVADWGMYAPMDPVWEDGPNGRRRKKLDEDGKEMLKITPMWGKGGPYMLGKCATALTFRRAFPSRTSGLYVHEEMHQADAQERARLRVAEAVESHERRSIAVQGLRDARAADPDAAPGKVPPLESMLRAGGNVPDLPGYGDRPAQTVATAHAREEAEAKVAKAPTQSRPTITDEQKREWLIAEVGLIATLSQSTPAAVMRRTSALWGKNWDDPSVPVQTLLAAVATLRPIAVQMLRSAGETQQAQAYAQVQPDETGPDRWLIGLDMGHPQPDDPTPLEGDVVGVDNLPGQ